MIIKKYLVDSIEEVQKKIAEDLGPNAVILTSRSVRSKGLKSLFSASKVEVVAAVEEADWEQLNPQKGELATEKAENDVKYHISTFQDSAERLIHHFNQLSSDDKSLYSTDDRELNKIIEQEINATSSSRYSPQMYMTEKPSTFVPFLVSKGVDPSIALSIEQKLDSNIASVDFSVDSPERTAYLNSFKETIAGQINIATPICLSNGSTAKVLIVGPSGVGKTTALQKIAQHCVQELGKKVAWITLTEDGGIKDEKGLNFAESLNIAFSLVTTNLELKQKLESYSDCDLILLDTVGSSSRIQILLKTLKGTQGLQTFIAMSATTKDLDFAPIINRFAYLHLEGAIFTMLDETATVGSFINFCHKTSLGISYITETSQVNKELHIADPKFLAHRILFNNL